MRIGEVGASSCWWLHAQGSKVLAPGLRVGVCPALHLLSTSNLLLGSGPKGHQKGKLRAQIPALKEWQVHPLGPNGTRSISCHELPLRRWGSWKEHGTGNPDVGRLLLHRSDLCLWLWDAD